MGNQQPRDLRRYVDMWALPGMHPSNVEFLQKLKTADSSHFNTHMDVVGTVSEQSAESGSWNQTHLVGVRTDIWKPDAKEMADALVVLQGRRRRALKKTIKKEGRLDAQQTALLDEQLAQDEIMKMQSGEIEKRRLVLKLFKTTGTRVRWCGTIEQVTTTEIHNSIGSKRNLLTMAVMLPRIQFVSYVQQNHRTFRIPSLFTFGYYDGRRMWHLTLKRRWISIGADFGVEADGKSIGMLDGRLFSFGSDSYIDLNAHKLTADTQFVDLVTLFTATRGYHRAMRKSVQRRVKATLAGKSHCHLIEDEELRLRHNGRAAA